MFIVTTHNQGTQFWLRGTTWAFRPERADKFESIEAAQNALAKSARFHHQKIIARATIHKVEA